MIMVCGVPKAVDVRWGFSFLQKPDKCGMWCQAGDHTTSAQHTDKSGAVRAYIEVRCTRTQRKWKAVEVPISQYDTFEWIAAGKVDVMAVGTGDTPIQGHIVGCTLVTKDVAYRVMISGKTEKQRRWK